MSRVNLDPVQFGIARTDEGTPLGYVRIGVFSTATAPGLSKALGSLQVGRQNVKH